MEADRPTVDFSLAVEDVRQICRSLDFHYAKWPGSEKGAEEQIRLRRLTYLFHAALMEVQYRTQD